jgi:hypothetical protein
VTRSTIYRYTCEGRFPKGCVEWFGRRAKYRVDVLEQTGWLHTARGT